MNQERIRTILRIIIFLIRTGQVKTFLTVLLWAIKSKASYDDVMARLYDPEYWNKKVRAAAERYAQEHYQTATVHIEGYDKFLEATKGVVKR